MSFTILPPGHPRHWHSYARPDGRGVWGMAKWFPNDWRCRVGQAIYAVTRAIDRRVADRIDPPSRKPAP